MNGYRLFRLKNKMLLGNLIANFIGILVVNLIVARSPLPYPPEFWALADSLDHIYNPFTFFAGMAFTLIYERPVRRYLDRVYRLGETVSDEDALIARRRLLNEPFALIAMDMFLWLTAAILYPAVLRSVTTDSMILGRIFFQTVLVGLITSIIAFFILERTLQKSLAPLFFPDGGLYATPKTIRVRIRVRLSALVIACNIVPCIAFLGIWRGTFYSGVKPETLLELARTTILTDSLIFMWVGLFLTWLVANNLARPFEEIIRVLRSISKGHLDEKVRVTSNDEIGYTGDVINDMALGLKEREKMRQSLALAREVQQNLLPGSPPVADRLDIAGKSIYCDQTGGDYFDYFDLDTGAQHRFALVVGDVSGHGISSALLMATARACLRQRSVLPGNASQIMADVNRQIARDVEETGQFMTLFYLELDSETMSLTWVRAGHEPAILYDPETDAFRELAGPGIALGLDADWQYEEMTLTDLSGGQVLVLGTDGIWEALNSDGEMFGRQRVQQVIRQNCHRSGQQIVEAVLADLRQFQNGMESDDDVTLVVAKIIKI